MRPLLSVLLLSALAACNVGPRYHCPSPCTPTRWKETQVATPPPVEQWWEVFQDDSLNRMMGQAIAKSPDLMTAMARICEAWATVGVSRADLYPQVTLAPSYLEQNYLFKLFVPNFGLFPPGFNALSTPFRIHQYTFGLPFNAQYEVDLWGKYRGQVKSALRTTQAKQQAYCTALLTLTSNLSNFYFSARALDTRITLLRETIGVLEAWAELNANRYTRGLTSADDLATTKLNLANSRAELEELIQQRALAEHAIAALMGIAAPEFTLPVHPLLEEPPEIPAGIPSEMLRRRPDIAEAERAMAAEHALIGVAYTSYLPSITLTGALGFLSPTFKDFLTWPSYFWSLGANVLQTVLDGGRNRWTVRAAYARFAQRHEEWRSSVLTAFREVEDALVSLETQRREAEDRAEASGEAQKLLKLASQRHQKGLASSLEVVSREQAALDAKRTEAALLGQRYLSTVQLIKALGGGWSSCEAAAEEPARGCQCAQGDHPKGPEVAEEDRKGHILEHHPLCDHQVVAQGVGEGSDL